MRLAAVALAVAVSAVSAAGCLDQTCTTILIWGITVDVTGPNNEALDATVTLRDGSYVEVIESEESFGTRYAGAGERAGTYEVTVEAAGFQTVVLRDVRVEDGGCHVEPARLDVQLQPL